jgi:hypothetical protein
MVKWEAGEAHAKADAASQRYVNHLLSSLVLCYLKQPSCAGDAENTPKTHAKPN